MTQEEKAKKERIESGTGINVHHSIFDETGYEIGYYDMGNGLNDVYVYVTNDCGEQVFFLHTNSAEKACGAIISYHQTLQAYCK